jgi:hypothetical protein
LVVGVGRGDEGEGRRGVLSDAVVEDDMAARGIRDESNGSMTDSCEMEVCLYIARERGAVVAAAVDSLGESAEASPDD